MSLPGCATALATESKKRRIAMDSGEAIVELVRKGGRVVWFGGLPGGTTLTLDPHKIHYGELTLLGTHGGTPLDAQRAFELLTSGGINSRALISDKVGLDQVQDALERMARGEVVKVAIDPTQP